MECLPKQKSRTNIIMWRIVLSFITVSRILMSGFVKDNFDELYIYSVTHCMIPSTVFRI